MNPLAQRLVTFVQPTPKGRLCDIGNQTIQTKTGEGPAEDYYKQLGWTEYTAFDIHKKWNSVSLDLNWRPDEVDGFTSYFGIFDFVVNNGSGEHIFDQSSVFQWCHDLCKEGGVMLHILPWTGWHNHGFYNFQPVLFRDLADANGYNIEALYAGERNGRLVRLDGVPGIDPYHHPKIHREPLSELERQLNSFGERANVFICVFLKKVKKEPFRSPIQGKYRGGHDGANRQGSVVGTAVSEDMGTVLSGAELSVVPTPFPHLVRQGCLDREYYGLLDKAWPSWEYIQKKDGKDLKENTLYHLKAKDVVQNPDIDPIWRKFFLRHLSVDFYNEMLKIFGTHLTDIMSKLPQEMKLGVRGTGDFDLVMDVQFAVNSPSGTLSSVRGPHIDSPDEIMAGLFYMPVMGDDGGGDITLYRWKDGVERKLHGKAEVDPAFCEQVAIVPYEPNTLLWFVNGQDAIHGISERKPSKFPRRYINFIVNAMKPVAWDLPR